MIEMKEIKKIPYLRNDKQVILFIELLLQKSLKNHQKRHLKKK